ncbi:MAG: serine/threonine-protein kinase [Actinomycetota bacterium]
MSSDAPTIQPPTTGAASVRPAGYGPPSEAGYSGEAPRGVYQPGQVVAGDLRIIAKVGEGGMGAVYRAKHLLLDREVAIKVHHSTNPDDAYRVEREAKAMARLKHPNVVGVWDVRRDGDALIITMEYLPNGTLRQAVERVQTWRERLELCLQAGDGLAAAHAAGLVHRDFKPDNVLIDRDGRAVVGDFGLARAPGPVQPSSPSRGPVPTPSDLDGQLTATGAVLGTPAYMAPEQYEGANVDARADQFAFCVVLYEALYGRRPFPGQSLPEILYSVSTGAMVMPPQNTEVPAEIWQLIQTGLSTDPAKRHRSMGALVNELRGQLRAPTERRLVVAIVVGSVCTLLLLGTVLGLFLYSTRERDVLQVQRMFPVRLERVEHVTELPRLETAIAEGRAAGKLREQERRARVDALLERLDKDPTLIGDPEFSNLLITAAGDDKELMELVGKIANAAIKSPGAINNLEVPPAEREGPLPSAAWDGKTTLQCGMNEKMELRDCEGRVASGPAIQAEVNCTVHLINCDIEAETIVAGHPKEVRIEGGHYTAGKSLVESKMPQSIVLLDVVMDSQAEGTAVDVGMNAKLRIERSTIWANVAIKAQMRVKAEIIDSRLIGKTASIDAGMHSSFELTRTELDGPVKKQMHAQVRDAP